MKRSFRLSNSSVRLSASLADNLRLGGRSIFISRRSFSLLAICCLTTLFAFESSITSPMSKESTLRSQLPVTLPIGIRNSLRDSRRRERLNVRLIGEDSKHRRGHRLVRI